MSEQTIRTQEEQRKARRAVRHNMASEAMRLSLAQHEAELFGENLNLNEDPLEGDTDHFVHPDETRTDTEIAHDERYEVDDYDDEEVEEPEE